jgi:hypothetical protein
MARSADTDEPVLEKQPCLQFRRLGSDDPDLQVDHAFPKRLRVLIGLRNKANADMGRRLGNRRHQRGAGEIDKPIVGPDRECARQCRKFKAVAGGLEHSTSIAGNFMYPIGELVRVRGRNQCPACLHEQLIPCGHPKPGQRSAHGGWA